MALPVSRTTCRTACRTARHRHQFTCLRSFHSYEHPVADKPFGDVEQAILAAAYKHVPEHGFSQRALGMGARDAGYLDISSSVLPDGSFSLIQYHLVTQREALGARAREMFDGLEKQPGAGAKVAALTWERLKGNKEVIHRWQDALAIMAQPSYVPPSIKQLALLSDEIWFLAGDKSVDPSWYTKRASLSMIYSTSELFMTNDKSPDFVDTHEFLHRRLEEVKSAGGAVGAVGQWVGFTMSAGLNVLRSKGLRV